MTTTGNGRAATSARRRGRRGDVHPGQEPIAALTPDLGPLPPIPVMHGAVLATDPTLVIARLIARFWAQVLGCPESRFPRTCPGSTRTSESEGRSHGTQ
jgi:hypothetical protein